jgi:hypothetical protein
MPCVKTRSEMEHVSDQRCWVCETSKPAADIRLRVDPTASEFFDGLVGAVPLCERCFDDIE